MDSCTSPSSLRLVPWRAVGMLLLALALLAVGRHYMVSLNPEMQFLVNGHEKKTGWLRHLAESPGKRLIFTGGSSCFTSIDPLQLEERFSLRAANMGVVAGIGGRVLVEYALAHSEAGDVLVLALEPGLLTGDTPHEPLGLQFLAATQQWDATSFSGMTERLSAHLSLRPNLYHLATLTGKVLMGRPLHRYQASEVTEAGWQQVSAPPPMAFTGPLPPVLSADGKSLLEEVAATCAERGIGLNYAFSWQYCPEADLAKSMEAYRRFAEQVGEVVQVLPDGTYGLQTNRDLFSDTELHPTVSGAKLRTKRLGEMLQTVLADHDGIWRKADPGA